MFSSPLIILEYENQEELHAILCSFWYESCFQMKHLKALHSFKFPLSKYNTIPVQFLPRKIQREDWWNEMVTVHNLVNVSFISPMKYQALRVSKLLLGFNPSKQCEFESCSSMRWLQELLQGRRAHCPALGAAVGPLGAGTVIRAWWNWGLSEGPAHRHLMETEDKGHLLHADPFSWFAALISALPAQVRAVGYDPQSRPRPLLLVPSGRKSKRQRTAASYITCFLCVWFQKGRDVQWMDAA